MTSQQTNDLFPDAGFPSNLHARILFNVLVLRTRKLFLLAGSLLIVLFVLTTWNLWNMAVETELVDLVSVILSGFELSFAYLSETAGIIANLFPVNALTLWSINVFSILSVAVALKKITNTHQTSIN